MSHTPYSFPMLQMLQLLHSPFITHYNPPPTLFFRLYFFLRKICVYDKKAVLLQAETPLIIICYGKEIHLPHLRLRL